MKCVLLAAGIGKRLRPVSRALPKCLLPVGGKPLLERTLSNLRTSGVRDIILVTGYKARQIRTFVHDRFPRHRITFVHNDRFETTNNAYSLSLCKELVGGEEFILLDSDILFGKGLLPFLLTRKRKPNRLAVRVRGSHDLEEIRVKINRWDHIVAIGKKVPLGETYGESIGIGVFSSGASERLFQILQERVKAGPGRREFYEASFQLLVDERHRIWAVDTSRHPSAEIDTPDDLGYAEEIILPLLKHE